MKNSIRKFRVMLLCSVVGATLAGRGALATAAGVSPLGPNTRGASMTDAHAPPERQGVDLLTFHRPNYFATGFTSRTQVKFQFSIKYELWPNRSGHALYFAYTQKSLWDVYAQSSPFRESNYNPELFYSFHHVRPGRTWRGCRLVSEQFGIDHESNGESISRSRSWNRIFAAMSAACVSRREQFVSWTPKLWLPFGLRENANIMDYVGYGELEVRYGTAQHDRWYGTGELALTGRKGTGTHGSLLVEFAWRPGYGTFARGWRFTPYLYAQYFTGQGETLLSYDRNAQAFRIGVGFRDQALLPN
jgi:phospholipase A1/A2